MAACFSCEHARTTWVIQVKIFVDNNNLIHAPMPTPTRHRYVSLRQYLRTHILLPLLRLLLCGHRCAWPSDNFLSEKERMEAVLGHRRLAASQPEKSSGLVA